MSKILYFFLCFIFMLSSIVEAEALYFTEETSFISEISESNITLLTGSKNLRQDKVVNWWENDIIVATGYGMKPQKFKSAGHAKSIAKRTAIMDGYRKLAQIAGAVHITANKKVVNTEVKASISGAKIISETFDTFGNCTVILQVPIYGVTNSFASAVLKPAKKENFPTPNKNIETLGTYTGVIIDCGDLEINPVLTPSIQGIDDKSIYSYNNLDSSQVIAEGMIGYKLKKKNKSSGNYLVLGATSTGESKNRVGNNPLIIKAVSLNNDGSCPVISDEDANKILSENQVSHFLDKGAVVFMSNRIRGMRM